MTDRPFSEEVLDDSSGLDSEELGSLHDSSSEAESPSASEPAGTPGSESQANPEVERLTAERDEYLDAARRVQAEFENYRRRVQRDQSEAADRSVITLVEQLLPVLDSFELAIASAGTQPESEGIRHGIGLVFAELLATLERAGLERVVSDGAVFDPNEHEAVLETVGAAPGSEPTVIETLRQGYRFKSRLVRPAMVKVIRSD